MNVIRNIITITIQNRGEIGGQYYLGKKENGGGGGAKKCVANVDTPHITQTPFGELELLYLFLYRV